MSKDSKAYLHNWCLMCRMNKKCAKELRDFVSSLASGDTYVDLPDGVIISGAVWENEDPIEALDSEHHVAIYEAKIKRISTYDDDYSIHPIKHGDLCITIFSRGEPTGEIYTSTKFMDGQTSSFILALLWR